MTILTLAALFAEFVPLAPAFLVASAPALRVNYPNSASFSWSAWPTSIWRIINGARFPTRSASHWS